MADLGQFEHLFKREKLEPMSSSNLGIPMITTTTPCGEAIFDSDKMAYICQYCFAVVGSICACQIED